jgi:hypothetical protein
MRRVRKHGRAPRSGARPRAVTGLVLVAAVIAAGAPAPRAAPIAVIPEPAAATPTPVAEDPWAAAAERWIAADLAAAHTGIAELVARFAEDVELDARPWSSRVATGRDAVLRELQASFGPTLDELAHRGVAVDAAGAAVQVRLDRDPRFRGAADLLEVREYGAQGMTRARVLASAAMLRRAPVAASPAAFAPLDAVVERRAASLRSGDGEPYRVARIPSTADRPSTSITRCRSPSRRWQPCSNRSSRPRVPAG